MVLWTVDCEIPKFFTILHWVTLFLNCWTICPVNFWQIGKLQWILAFDQLSLSGCSIDTQSWHYHLFLINLWKVLGPFWEFSQSFVAPGPTFLFGVASLKFKMRDHLMNEWMRFTNLNTNYIVCVLFSIDHLLCYFKTHSSFLFFFGI